MNASEALSILDRASDAAALIGPDYRAVKQAVQVLTPIIAAHEAQAKAAAENDKT